MVSGAIGELSRAGRGKTDFGNRKQAHARRWRRRTWMKSSRLRRPRMLPAVTPDAVSVKA